VVDTTCVAPRAATLRTRVCEPAAWYEALRDCSTAARHARCFGENTPRLGIGPPCPYLALTPHPHAVIPLAFALNLLGTLSSSGVILFVNSLQATPAVMHKLFGDKTNEHTIMRYPAFFLVGGVGSLFLGFACGICLYYGLLVASLIVLFVLAGIAFYECYWARGHGDTYNALNMSLASLFFRSCMPDLAKVTDEHPHLNPPPLAKDVEKGETSKKHEEL
jgi:hypothetical protein